MATLASTDKITLVEHAKRIDPVSAYVVEVLAETNKILDDIPFVEGNQQFGHKTTRRASLPTASWRELNKGVGKSTSKTTQVMEGIGMLEVYSELDKMLVDNSGNPAEYRQREDKPFIMGMTNDFADALIYGDPATAPAKFKGFAPRRASIGSYCVDGSGSGSDLSSIYVCQWGLDKLHGFWPKGSKAGISVSDKGQVTLEDSDGNQYEGYRTHFQWHAGIAERDERSLWRYANIETAGSTNIFDVDLLIEILDNLPYDGMGAVIYANKTIRTQINIAAKSATNVQYGIDEFGGQVVVSLRGVPIRTVDAILDTESELT